MSDSVFHQPRFYTIEQLKQVPPPKWLVTELFEADSLVMVAGPPGSYKSFLVLDWLLHLASGRTHWHDKRLTPTRVAYALGEGRNSLLTRINAWIRYNDPTPEQKRRINENFKVTFEVPQLAHRAQVDNMLRDLEGFNPGVIAIDTFQRASTGLDENGVKDMGMCIEQCEFMRSKGITSILVHHTAKNTEFGVKPRGSTALTGAMDTVFTVNRNKGSNAMTMTVDKQKNYEEIKPIKFQACKVNWAGNPEGAIVLVPDIPRVTVSYEDPTLSNQAIKEILTTYPNESQRASAARLANKLGIGDSAALSRIHRYLTENQGVIEGLDVINGI